MIRGYMKHRLGQEDIGRYHLSIGFPDSDGFYTAILAKILNYLL